MEGGSFAWWASQLLAEWEKWWLGDQAILALPKHSAVGSRSWLSSSLAPPLLHTFQTTAPSTLLLLQCTPHLCPSPLASPGSPHSLLHPQHPLSCLFPSSSAAAEFTCLHCCPSFRSLLNPPPHVFYPWAFSQALSFMTSAGEAPKKQTASGFSLHSQTPRQCHAGGHPQGSLGSAPTVQEGKKCILPEEFFR